MRAILAWCQQKTTIAGISVLLGVASALLAHQTDLAHAMPVIIAALTSIGMPEAGATLPAALGPMALGTIQPPPAPSLDVVFQAMTLAHQLAAVGTPSPTPPATVPASTETPHA